MVGIEKAPFSPQEVGIVTTTQYPEWAANIEPLANESKVRGDLALKMLDEGLRLGAQLLVVDSELSSPEFQFQIISRQIPLIPRTINTLSGQRRDAISEIRKNTSIKAILMNDPEKVSLVTDGLERCVQPILDGEADIVIPQRDRKLFVETYPAPQVIYEREQNEIINRGLRQMGIMKPEHPDFDWLIGARFLANKPEVTNLFLDEYQYAAHALQKEGVAGLLNPEMWPNGQYIPVIAALVKGMRVKSIWVPYKHPQTQTNFENAQESEFTAKRQRQVKNIVVGSIQGGKAVLGDPRALLSKVE